MGTSAAATGEMHFPSSNAGPRLGLDVQVGFRGQQGAMDEGGGVRIRLKFQDAAVLTTEQIEQGLAQSWYLVRLQDLRTVADVSSDIVAAFKLEESCPNGLSLEMDGFALPASQPARLLKESDLIRVRRSSGGQDLPVVPILSDEPWNRHVSDAKDHVLDEVHDGDEDVEEEMSEGLPQHKRRKAGEESGTLAGTENRMTRGRKKRKKSDAVIGGKDNSIHAGDIMLALEPGEAELGARCEGATFGSNKGESVEHVVQRKKRKKLEYADGGFGSKEDDGKIKKRKKCKKDDLSNQLLHEDHTPSHPNGVKSISETGAGGPCDGKQKKRVLLSPPKDGSEHLVRKANDRQDPTTGLHSSSKQRETRQVLCTVADDSDDDEESLSKEEPVADESNSPEEESARTQVHRGIGGSKVEIVTKRKDAVNDQVNDIVAGMERRPSRSARRKKAKRHWQRERAKMGDLQKSLSYPDSNGLDIESGSGMSTKSIQTGAGEAVEDLKPVVVKAGHIRFEALDDDEVESDREAMPVIQLGEKLMTKRQGQKWGQEKTVKHGSNEGSMFSNGVMKVSEPCDEWRTNRNDYKLDSAAFEQLPPLGEPQVGDIVVYRVVELGPLWTPQISSIRIGAVDQWNKTNGILKLNPVNSVLGTENFDDENAEHNEINSLYDEAGVLEIEPSAFVDARLLQRDASNDNRLMEGLSNDDKTKDVEDGMETGKSRLWQDVDEELEKKKMELLKYVAGSTDKSQSIDMVSGSGSGPEPHQDTSHPPAGNRNSSFISGESPSKKTRRQHRKNAGVGSILALLREQGD